MNGIPLQIDREKIYSRFEEIIRELNILPISSLSIRNTARTLQERAFSRITWSFYKDGIQFGRGTRYAIKPENDYFAQTIMAACRAQPQTYKLLSRLPIMNRPTRAGDDYEMVEALQDLADLVSWEITSAFKDSYFPGVQKIEPIDPEHVSNVMIAMQRELDRENSWRHKSFPMLADLPWQRQVALAERRRHWFDKFGITPESWKTGYWSIWRVSDEEPPEGPKYSMFVPQGGV